MIPAAAEERYLVDGDWVGPDEARLRARVDRLPDRMSRALDLLGQGTVADIGCYSGDFVAELLRREPARDVIGIDYDEEGLKLARLLHPEIADRFRRSSVYELDLADESVDCVSFQEVIEHLEGAALAVKEINRVLRPGGTLVVTTPNAYALGHFLNFARSELVMSVRRRPPALGSLVFFEEWEWNRHIFCWTPATLLTLLQVNGFAYETHTYAADPQSLRERAILRIMPFLGTEIVLRVRKVAPAPSRMV